MSFKTRLKKNQDFWLMLTVNLIKLPVEQASMHAYEGAD